MKASFRNQTTLLGGWLGHLLVTPPFHRALEKANELIGISEARRILCVNHSKIDKFVKEIPESFLGEKNCLYLPHKGEKDSLVSCKNLFQY